MKPQRIQLSRAKGWRMPANTVKVDRSTKWGSPFVVGEFGTREECVRFFTLMLTGLICLGGPAGIADAQVAYLEMARRDIGELCGKNVGCWCSLPKPGEPDICHGAVLVEAANKRRRKA